MMCAEAYQFDDIGFFVNPYQQEIILNVALHAAFVVAMKLVGFVVRWYRLLIG